MKVDECVAVHWRNRLRQHPYAVEKYSGNEVENKMSVNPTIMFPRTRKVEIEYQAMPVEERDLLLKTKYSAVNTGTELSVPGSGI